ncbi:cation-independent mannose-6-phosphate receptor isoform X2 [Leptopilina boulardi]|uniref:cation-independent mannose-6-phosphate receptor isoform X2 n=1 Tax=Leptopilina boulardi TaxID=63433 RepID=UPI0021F5EFD6|nr:cation-independent mannose-6-phosphate receptor isoform X2 [Leptopilina boulardi]
MKLTIKIFCICVFLLLLTSVSRATNNEIKKKENICLINENEKQMKKFNFTNILSKNIDYKITTSNSDEVIYLQLCSPLQKTCNGKNDYGLCLTKHGNEIGLGKYPPELKIEAYQILFQFTGDKCNDSANYTTLVKMQCDYKAEEYHSNPIVIPHKENQCEIDIHWKTSLACGEQTITNCSVIDSTGFKYDLSKLTKYSDNYEIPVQNSSKILLNVCHSLIFGYGVSCINKAGSCLVNSNALRESGESLGEVWKEKPLSIVEDGHLQLVYDEGGMCSEGSNHYKTIINFICDHYAEDSHPKYVNGTCDYHIEWKTPLACKGSFEEHKVVTRTKESIENKPDILSIKKEEPPKKLVENKQVNCGVITKKGKIDLSPLILTKENYIVKSNDLEFHINVCNPLTSPANFKSCQGKTVCKIQRDGDGRNLKETSLGNPGENPIVYKNESVILHYKFGAVCPEKNNNTISTNITFKCDYFTKKSSPQFDKYTDCTYLFKWTTINVCETVVGNFYDNCTISNPFLRTFDFSVLRDQTFRIYNDNKNYSISICGEKNLCNGSTICEGNNGLGTSINVIYDYPKDSVKLEFSKGTKCLNDTFKSDITFVCNSTANVGSPVLISKSSESCHLQFEWQTSLVCTSASDNSTSPKKPIPPSDTKDAEKKAEIASSNGVFLVSLITGVVIIVVIVMYLRDPSRRARCSRFVTSPCSSSSNDRVKYCRD